MATTVSVPFTLYHNLGAVQFAAAQAEALLVAVALGSADRHEDHVATFPPQRHARHEMCPVLAGRRSSVTSGLPDEDPWIFTTHLLCRFEQTHNLDDLQRAISLLDACVQSGSIRDQRSLAGLANLGVGLSYRFQFLGDLNDLEQAILRQQEAIDLISDHYHHPDKPHLLDNLGDSLRARFQYLGDLDDLEKAVSMQQDAVRLTPASHHDRATHLNHLGNSYLVRFERLGELSDLDHAILRQREAVDLIPDQHPDKPLLLDNLGGSLRARFQHLGNINDLEKAISMQHDAVRFTPASHHDRPIHLNHLGNSYLVRFEHLRELSDLNQAILRQREAVDLLPDQHPDKPHFLNNLGDSLRARFQRLAVPSDLEQATSLYSRAALASTGPASTRFRACQRWILCARDSGHDSLLRAYSQAIDLLHQLAWIGLSLTHRYDELIKVANVVHEAAAAALDAGHPETAVEWLEQGRSIVWGEFFQLRNSYEELSAAYPDHARRLSELSDALQSAVFTHEKSLSSRTKRGPRVKPARAETLEQAANRHHMLATERDKLLQEIRVLPGFERFLLRKELTQLRASAQAGPVVILNAARHRCDALIVRADLEHVIHVPLPTFTLERSAGLQDSLKSLFRNAHEMPLDERVGKPALQNLSSQWEIILSTLWKSIVKPVLESLSISTPGNQSRIFWSPSGPLVFLPLHAAGLYDKDYSEPGHKVFDFVVSSYVPILSILVPSPSTHLMSSNDLRLLVVHQPPSDGLPHLPGVNHELRYIKSVIENSPSARTTLLEPPGATVEEVLDLMKKADWVHFACHGIQDTENLTESGLCLANGRRLKLSDMIALSRPRGGLAFLSACQTATGDKRLSDEAIHIAAGMLFAGYAGVVGTMWSISDSLAPGVARDVYEQLFQTGTMPDTRAAARALHDAVGRLRESGASFSEWLPFVHLGL